MIRSMHSFVAATAVLLACTTALAAPKITFFGHSEVAGDRVMLEDVARVQGADDDLRQRLRSVDLGAAPQPLQQRTLSQPVVARALKEAGVDELRVVFPKRMVVWRPGQKLAANDVTTLSEKAVMDYIAGAAPKGYRARLDGLIARGELLLPAGEVSAVATSRSTRLGGSMVFSIAILVDGREAAHKQVSARVELEGPSCRLATDVQRGTVLTRSDLVEHVGPVERDGIACDAAVGMSVRSSGRAGNAIRGSGLEAPIVIRRGDSITVEYESGILRILTKGEAMKDGAVGEVIPIVNLDSKKVMRARIVSPGRARMQ